jgi:HTH-type transcriptional regulator / antitoxin HigA
MASSRFALKRGKDSYLALVQTFPLASLKSEAHFAEAQAVVDRLVAKGPLDEGEELYLDALTDLIGTFEEVHHTIEAGLTPTCSSTCSKRTK